MKRFSGGSDGGLHLDQGMNQPIILSVACVCACALTFYCPCGDQFVGTFWLDLFDL